jgi:hypothetical protein
VTAAVAGRAVARMCVWLCFCCCVAVWLCCCVGWCGVVCCAVAQAHCLRSR